MALGLGLGLGLGLSRGLPVDALRDVNGEVLFDIDGMILQEAR